MRSFWFGAQGLGRLSELLIVLLKHLQVVESQGKNVEEGAVKGLASALLKGASQGFLYAFSSFFLVGGVFARSCKGAIWVFFRALGMVYMALLVLEGGSLIHQVL